MSELVYVSAQPDVPYFHWQCEVYGFNFVEKGIDPSNIHMIFAIVGPNGKPTKKALELRDQGFKVHFYNDFREKKHYIPSIKPYLISNWLRSNPEFGKCFFLHDADIIFREKPDYDKYTNDNICYLSNTKSYISYDYLSTCSKKYAKIYNLNDNELIKVMVDVLGISVECLKKNIESSGGGQYIIKKTNYKDWYKIYLDSVDLYDVLINFHNTYPINNGIQMWTAEMWSVLWNLWCLDKETKIIEDLNFSWATDSVDIYNQHPILHMAGVLENDKNTKFYKGEFININPIEKLIENIQYFEYIDPNSSTIKYIEFMKSLIKKRKSNYL